MNTVTFGNSLNQVLQSTERVLASAKNEKAYEKIEGICQFRQTIENAIVVYQDLFNTPLDKADTLAKSILQDLQRAINNVDASLAVRAQELFNRIPFHENHVRVAVSLPRFILRSDAKLVCFNFFGNFNQSVPELIFQGKAYQPSLQTKEKLEFSLAPNCIFSGKVPSTKDLIFGEGELKVPISSKVNAIYKVTIGTLPTSPGNINIHWTTDRVVRHHQNRSDRHTISSKKEHGNDDQINRHFHMTASPGWTMSTHSITMHHCEGNEPDDRNSPGCFHFDGQKVSYAATTRHKGMGTSGHMDFSVNVSEYQDVRVIDDHNTGKELTWGDEVYWDAPLGRWDVQFKAFDGKEYVYKSVDTTSSPYVKVEQSGNRFVIKAPKLKDLEGI